jgi:hypothetical protein
MPSDLSTTWGLVDALKAEGFPVPENCVTARVDMSFDAPISLEYRVLLTAEQVAQLGRALARLAEGQSA